MTEPTEVLRVAADEDLLPLTMMLRRSGVAHRIFEDGGEQVLEVADPAQCEPVRTLYRRWRAGEIDLTAGAQPAVQRRPSIAPWRTPVTTMLILLSLAGFAVVYLGRVELIALLTYSPFELSQGSVVFSPNQNQYWRLVTPAFLHFGWLHIVFNALWTWELGRRLELFLGSVNLALLFLVTAVVANVSQFLVAGPTLFGGMSGVVFGLLGFSWVAGTVNPRWPLRPRGPIMLFMIAWLVICLIGVVEMLGFGAVANAAHVGGLLSGALAGLVFGLAARGRGRSA